MNDDPYGRYLRYFSAVLEVANQTDTHAELTSAATLLLAGALRHVEDPDLAGLAAVGDVLYLSGVDQRPSAGRTH
jgi:hypothetical protein